MAAASAEAAIAAIVVDQNKPFGLQQLVDLGATKSLKKAQVSKAVDALVADGRILCKEFGKTKVFLAPQAGLKVLSKEETESRKALLTQLQQQQQKEMAECKQLEQELSQLRSTLTEEEIARQTAELTKKLAADEAKLKTLKAGTVLITAEEREQVQKQLSSMLEAWRKRRSMFRNIWGTISESLEGKQSELFEEMGVETDEAAGADMGAADKLLPAAGAKRRR